MAIPSRMFNGKKYVRCSNIFYSKKEADKAVKWYRSNDYKVRLVKTLGNSKEKYKYQLYVRSKEMQ
jgi:hypothetical protein